MYCLQSGCISALPAFIYIGQLRWVPNAPWHPQSEGALTFCEAGVDLAASLTALRPLCWMFQLTAFDIVNGK